jgi:eukaryotic-like serine/threonine-protein kinase
MGAPGRGAPGGSSPDFHQGERIGKYQVITQLSMGGMAELFLGFTSGPGGFRKYVAIKRILPDVRTNEQFERMFLDEARITAAFNHPNIAQVYELGQEEDGLFLAMEFIAGQNLDQLTLACQQRQEPVPLGFSTGVVRDVCQALHYAHTFMDPSGRPSPVIHRDVAQKNIMVTYDGVVKLLDFGIAKARNSLERTSAGMVKGTAGYMSPEQVRGEKLDGRSDVFSVGVVLWELITGARLFAGKTEREEMVNILEARIPPPRHRSRLVSDELSAIILKALERNPGDRFQSAKELARALEQETGRAMFDADRRAALMRELFEKKMTATRMLLESADPVAGGGEPAGAQGLELSVPAQGGGTELYEPKPPDTKPDDELEAQLRALKTQVAPMLTEDSSLSGSRWSTARWVVGLLAIVVGGISLVMKVVPALNEEVPPEPPVQTSTGPKLKEFTEPGQTPAAAGTAADGGTAAGGMAVADGKEGKAAREEDKSSAGVKEEDDKRARPARVAQGKLTLVIFPESEVFLGKRSLGKTPLFNVPLPAGKHLLRIKGPDGKVRALSVPIEAGKLAMHRVPLENIPEAR